MAICEWNIYLLIVYMLRVLIQWKTELLSISQGLYHKVVPRMCSFLILSLLVTPHIHRSILISVTSIRLSRLFVVAHISAPYSMAGLIIVLYTFHFSFTGILLSHSTPLHFFQFIQPAPTHPRFVISVSIPPSSSILVPRYLK